MAHRPINTAELRLARRKAGLTQAQLANRIKYSRNTVSRSELGLSCDAVIEAIAREYGVTPETFYRKQPGSDGELTDVETEIVGLLREMKPDGQRAAKHVILGLWASREYQRVVSGSHPVEA